jgi:hypothetical protein
MLYYFAFHQFIRNFLHDWYNVTYMHLTELYIKSKQEPLETMIHIVKIRKLMKVKIDQNYF